MVRVHRRTVDPQRYVEQLRRRCEHPRAESAKAIAIGGYIAAGVFGGASVVFFVLAAKAANRR